MKRNYSYEFFWPAMLDHGTAQTPRQPTKISNKTEVRLQKPTIHSSTTTIFVTLEKLEK